MNWIMCLLMTLLITLARQYQLPLSIAKMTWVALQWLIGNGPTTSRPHILPGSPGGIGANHPIGALLFALFLLTWGTRLENLPYGLPHTLKVEVITNLHQDFCETGVPLPPHGIPWGLHERGVIGAPPPAESAPWAGCVLLRILEWWHSVKGQGQLGPI